ncbi:hypothetical protein SESBI_32093 [Sesbania bispinosa]|nr:hypothetical protein SESBI_32093 [Sesbania bispinosa]
MRKIQHPATAKCGCTDPSLIVVVIVQPTTTSSCTIQAVVQATLHCLKQRFLHNNIVAVVPPLFLRSQSLFPFLLAEQFHHAQVPYPPLVVSLFCKGCDAISSDLSRN